MPQIVTPADEYLASPCTELWADPDALAEERDIEPDEAAYAVLEATWAINVLTGDQFSGVQCLMEDYAIRPGQVRLQLQRKLKELVLVQKYSGELAPLFELPTPSTGGAYVIGGSLLHLQPSVGMRSLDPMYSMDRLGCADSAEMVRVVYKTLNTVPAGAERIVKRLAYEYVLASRGDTRCKLPDGIQSVNRQGISWTVQDPYTLFQRGNIGIGEIDHWLDVVNINARSLHAVNTLHAGTLRRRVVIGCGENCGTGDWMWPPVDEDGIDES